MRSVVVVLPESMCADMPMLRMWLRASCSFSVTARSACCCRTSCSIWVTPPSDCRCCCSAGPCCSSANKADCRLMTHPRALKALQEACIFIGDLNSCQAGGGGCHWDRKGWEVVAHTNHQTGTRRTTMGWKGQPFQPAPGGFRPLTRSKVATGYHTSSVKLLQAFVDVYGVSLHVLSAQGQMRGCSQLQTWIQVHTK